jgi:hypothetical protein
MPVAEFYDKIMQTLRDLGIEVKIWTMPVEIANAIPFEKDQQHKSYDADAAQRFWRVLVQADRLMKQFRAGFIGKVSPVHFFWGSFDLAVTRFSGRTAPPHPGGMPNLGDWVAREAYSHEVSSCGFWPGNGGFGKAAFYSYAYPAPRDLPMRSCCRRRHRSIGRLASLFWITTSSDRRTIPTPWCSIFFGAPTRPLPTQENGIAPRWSGKGLTLESVRRRSGQAVSA